MGLVCAEKGVKIVHLAYELGEGFIGPGQSIDQLITHKHTLISDAERIFIYDTQLFPNQKETNCINKTLQTYIAGAVFDTSTLFFDKIQQQRPRHRHRWQQAKR